MLPSRTTVASVWLAVTALLPTAAVDAQTGDKTLRVGILSSGVLENRSPLDTAFVQGLHEQGYVEGKNLVIERRYSSARLADNAKELAAMHLDAVVTTCTPSTRMMKEASGSTPIVMIAVSDPVRQGVIAS